VSTVLFGCRFPTWRINTAIGALHVNNGKNSLENTKGFSLRTLKHLVMDEADRLLDMDFGPVLDKSEFYI
jgi:hypothetical protein